MACCRRHRPRLRRGWEVAAARAAATALLLSAPLAIAAGPAAAAAAAPAPVIAAVDVSVSGTSATATFATLGTPASASLRWRLLGPVPLPSSGCSKASFVGAARLSSGLDPIVIGGSATTRPIALPQGASGCIRFAASLVGSDGSSLATTGLSRPDGVGSLSQARLTTAFLDPLMAASWSAAAARAQLSAMATAGVTRVILQQTSFSQDQGDGRPSRIYTTQPAPSAPLPPAPSSPVSPGYRGADVVRSTAVAADGSAATASIDQAARILDAADSAGVGVVLGLNGDVGTWALPQATTQTSCSMRSAGCAPTAWMESQLAAGEQTALELASGAIGHPSFAGWYLPVEFGSSSWTSPAAVSDLAWLEGGLARFAASLTPGRAVILAPYVDRLPSSASLPSFPGCASYAEAGLAPIWDTPCQFGQQLAAILKAGPITELMLQDGLSDPKASPYLPMTQAALGRWTTAASRAAAAASAARGQHVVASVDVDLYATDAYSLGPAELSSHLALAAATSGEASGFCWAHLAPGSPASAALLEALAAR